MYKAENEYICYLPVWRKTCSTGIQGCRRTGTCNAPQVSEGSIVIHKSFGEGTVTKLDKAQKHIRVKFAVGEKTFIFPDAFKQGFLKTK